MVEGCDTLHQIVRRWRPNFLSSHKINSTVYHDSVQVAQKTNIAFPPYVLPRCLFTDPHLHSSTAAPQHATILETEPELVHWKDSIICKPQGKTTLNNVRSCNDHFFLFT